MSNPFFFFSPFSFPFLFPPVILVGADTIGSSGLGFATCCRLIDDFLSLHRSSPERRLTIVFTTRRSRQASAATEAQIRRHADRHGAAASSRIRLIAETVDLQNLHAVRALARRLDRDLPKLDAIILNAGIGGWDGLNWPLTIWKVLTDVVHATTWPCYKIGTVGQVTAKQTNLASRSKGAEKEEKREEPPLGAVFCANVFGHYLLTHLVNPLLRRGRTESSEPGRIIWLSSLEATPAFYDPDDIQGLRNERSYESSKQLTDLLALTSDLPCAAPYVERFLPECSSADNGGQGGDDSPRPAIYVTHPGICGTSIVPLILPLVYCMMAAFYLARWLGSPWHTIYAYMGAAAPAWVALSPQSTLDAAEAPYRARGGGRVKWGSSASRWLGTNRVISTEVEGWGHGGVVGPPFLQNDAQLRRKRGLKLSTEEDRKQFEALGCRAWREMEELREQWEQLLDEDERE